MSEVQSQIDSLNPDQKEVALCMGHCLAIAAPGSGKTKTLAVKAAYLLEKGHTVTAVTFTRDAALELRDRIIALAGREALPNLLVGTFHSIDLLMAFPAKARSGMGSNILKAGHSKLTRQWEIVKEATRRSIVDRAITQAGLVIERDEGTRLIETIKSGYVKPENEEQAKLVKAYAELLRRHGVIDFQDILLETNKAMANGQISPLRTKHLMIDEFQDTDATQFQWAMQHAGAGCVLTAVGDDDQSIYGFRRALGYKGMSEFHDRLQATRIVLGMNYRSHKEVLDPSATLIRVNQDRMDKDLVAYKGTGGDAFWDRFGTRTDEASMCHEWLRAALDRGETVGVLARTNKRLDVIEAQCVKHGTPYVRAEGGSILQSREMAVFVAAIGLATRNNMLDADEVLAWMQLTEDDIAGIHRTLGNRGIMQLDAAGLKQLPLAADARSKVSTLVNRFGPWRHVLETGGTKYFVEQIHDLLAAQVGDDNRVKRALETIREIFLKPVGKEGSGVAQMSSRLERIRDMMEGRNQKEDAGDQNKVSLMTAHGSKGLEWDNVQIIGAEQGAFPDETASLQEERRLFFVAMTRARKHLRVSASGSKPLSQFVDEAGLLRVPEPPEPILEIPEAEEEHNPFS